MRTPTKAALVFCLIFSAALSSVAGPLQSDRTSRVRSDRTPLTRGAATPMRQAPVYRHGGGHRYGGYHGGYYGYPWRSWGYYGWPYYWGPYFDRYDRADTGAVDLNVKPRSTRVFLNGYLLGKVSRYDGFPSHLYLPQGNYELIFYKKGYETVRKEIRIVGGTTLRANFDMERGKETPVKEMTRVTSEPETIKESLYNRYSKDRPSAQPGVRRETKVTTLLQVGPADAVIYLDGEFLGTAKMLQRNGGQLYLDPGDHTIEVTRPGYSAEKIEFKAELGKTESFTVTLAEAEDE